MSTDLLNICEIINSKLKDAQGEVQGNSIVVNKKKIKEVVKLLKDHKSLLFTTIIDICGVDFPERDERFEVVYHFLSMEHNKRVRIKVSLEENEKVDSIIGIFAGANWFEREAFDMYGIIFDGHNDMRRILTDYNFEGYPLRKDFPLTGFVEVRYNNEKKEVVYESVSLPQAYREFDFLSPWFK